MVKLLVFPSQIFKTNVSVKDTKIGLLNGIFKKEKGMIFDHSF